MTINQHIAELSCNLIHRYADALGLFFLQNIIDAKMAIRHLVIITISLLLIAFSAAAPKIDKPGKPGENGNNGHGVERMKPPAGRPQNISQPIHGPDFPANFGGKSNISDEDWDKFKKHYNKTYKNKDEEKAR